MCAKKIRKRLDHVYTLDVPVAASNRKQKIGRHNAIKLQMKTILIPSLNSRPLLSRPSLTDDFATLFATTVY
ncbi:MAG: hypothetical protein JWM99_1580 [Verrucomicrobiales bacterium]|nr:hypothetical protein [Verrucomicrobiales bacterium]